MIKTILTALIIFLTVQLTIYTFATFVSWEPNPGNWRQDGRLFAALSGFLFGAAAVSGYISFKNDE